MEKAALNHLFSGGIWDKIFPGKPGMFQKVFKSDKERQRYYLLPGMGGRALRRKRVMMLQWSLAVGLIASVIVWLALYWSSTPRP